MLVEIASTGAGLPVSVADSLPLPASSVSGLFPASMKMTPPSPRISRLSRRRLAALRNVHDFPCDSSSGIPRFPGQKSGRAALSPGDLSGIDPLERKLLWLTDRPEISTLLFLDPMDKADLGLRDDAVHCTGSDVGGGWWRLSVKLEDPSTK